MEMQKPRLEGVTVRGDYMRGSSLVLPQAEHQNLHF